MTYLLFKLHGANEDGSVNDELGDGPLFEGASFAGVVEADSSEAAVRISAGNERSAETNKGLGRYFAAQGQLVSVDLSAT